MNAAPSPEQLLDEIDRSHDDAPDAAAARLRALPAAALPAARLGRYAFLVNHLLIEKAAQPAAALALLGPLAQRADAPPALRRQLAVAAHCAGDAEATARATAAWARQLGGDEATARLALRVAALAFGAAAPDAAATLDALAGRAVAQPPGPFDESLAAGFNNASSALLAAARARPSDAAPGATLAQALRRGADAALLFWQRAGGWLQHERAHYLCAKVALFAGDAVAAAAHAESGLAIVATRAADPGEAAIERAFLLPPLAAAAERSGARARAQALRDEAAVLAATLDPDTQALLAQDRAEHPPLPAAKVAFIGGGNMALALIGGLQRAGVLSALHVVELHAERRAELARDFGATTAAAPDAALAGCDAIVLAVKPQQLRAVCAALAPHVGDALVLSIAAGIRAADIARWLGTPRVVRAMPNTPALIGQGISGVAALPGVDEAQRRLAAQVLAGAGPVVWVDDEAQLDAVTAVSGSGPAYVFHFIEALAAAGQQLGLGEAQARRLTIATFAGAAQLATQSAEPVSLLRERVTSKGGTTAAALARMAEDGIAQEIAAAAAAACTRARELGDEFGRG